MSRQTKKNPFAHNYSNILLHLSHEGLSTSSGSKDGVSFCINTDDLTQCALRSVHNEVACARNLNLNL